MWHGANTCRQAKDLIRAPCQRDTRFFLKLSRVRLRLMAAFVTGHGPFCYSLFRSGLITSDRCSCGEAAETAMHVMADCPRFSLIRLETWGDTTVNTDDIGRGGVHSLYRFACRVADALGPVV